MKHILPILLVVALAAVIVVSFSIVLTSVDYAGLMEKNETSTALDSDMDGLKDDVELLLGTDPNHRDADHDGLTDAAFLAAKAAGLDTSKEDLDGDGIPNVWELYGYTYNRKTFEIEPWYVLDEDNEPVDGSYFDAQGNPIKYYKTDPTQPSTDQDPYDDYMEVVGVSVGGIPMDKSVISPGTLPVVPAYPDIFWSMVSCEVQPRSTITSYEGGLQESAWNNSINNEKISTETWDQSFQADVKVDKKGAGGSAKYQTSSGSKTVTSSTVESSTSGFDMEAWYQATTVDANHAANIVVSLKLQNLGTAAAHNISPKASLSLGDKGLMFWEQEADASPMVNALAPGETYSSALVIGGGADEIPLTLDQLRSLQLGAPFLLSVPEWNADVVQKDKNGYWQVVAKWDSYRASIDGVSASLSVDTGEGAVETYRVYATDPNGTGPLVKLRDVLAWTVGYRETVDGILVKNKPLSDYRFGFDDDHIADVQAQLGAMGDSANLMDLVIGAGWDISLKASKQPSPEVLWANWSLVYAGAEAYVTDDYNITSVVLRTNSRDYPMTYDGSSGTYKVVLPDYSYTGRENIVATNDRENTGAMSVGLASHTPVWGMFRHDAQHTGRSEYIGSQNGVLKWRLSVSTPKGSYYPADPPFISSPAIAADGTIYLWTGFKREQGNLRAIYDNGQRATFGGYYVFDQYSENAHSSPAIDPHGKIYIGLPTLPYYEELDYYVPNNPICLFATLPDMKSKSWYTTRGPIYSSPTIGPDGTIYLGISIPIWQDVNTDPWHDEIWKIVNWTGIVKALTPVGAQKWALQTTKPVVSSPALSSDGILYVGSDDGYLYALQAADGKLVWKYKIDWYHDRPARVISSPAIGPDGTVYVGGEYNGLYAVQKNGQTKWTHRFSNSVSSSPAIGPDGTVYVGCSDGYFYAFRPTDGHMKWSYQTGASIGSSPAIGADGTIYFGSVDTYFYALKPDGSLLWRYKTGGVVNSSPAIGADGTVYIYSYDGYLYAFKGPSG